MARACGLALLVAAFALAGAFGASDATAAGWPECTPRSTPIRTGITEVGRTRIDDRLVHLTLRSKAMGDEQPVDVFLPNGYRSSQRRYPVLYLLHGAGEGSSSWIEDFGIRELTAGMPLIVVMPQGSRLDAEGNLVNGGYADWFGSAAGSTDVAPAWESFHIDELLPFIDSHLRTKPDAAHRAVAGISMGGGGAVKYAAQHPGTFGYAGSFSGELEPGYAPAQAVQPKNCKYGDPATEQVVWQDNDPTILARNLRGVRLFIRSGDGTVGPLDPTPTTPTEAAVLQVRQLVEFGAHQMALDFLAAAERAKVDRIDAAFYPGTHSRPYWSEQLPVFFDWLRAQLRDPIGVRDRFQVKSAHRRFTAWGWSFATHRKVREFAYVNANGDRLRLTGSGRIRITTPPRLRPGAEYTVSIGSKRHRSRAGGDGSLSFSVDLGPSHTTQQTEFSPAARADWRSATVRISRRAR